MSILTTLHMHVTAPVALDTITRAKPVHEALTLLEKIQRDAYTTLAESARALGLKLVDQKGEPAPNPWEAPAAPYPNVGFEPLQVHSVFDLREYLAGTDLPEGIAHVLANLHAKHGHKAPALPLVNARLLAQLGDLTPAQVEVLLEEILSDIARYNAVEWLAHTGLPALENAYKSDYVVAAAKHGATAALVYDSEVDTAPCQITQADIATSTAILRGVLAELQERAYLPAHTVMTHFGTWQTVHEQAAVSADATANAAAEPADNADTPASATRPEQDPIERLVLADVDSSEACEAAEAAAAEFLADVTAQDEQPQGKAPAPLPATSLPKAIEGSMIDIVDSADVDVGVSQEADGTVVIDTTYSRRVTSLGVWEYDEDNCVIDDTCKLENDEQGNTVYMTRFHDAKGQEFKLYCRFPERLAGMVAADPQAFCLSPDAAHALYAELNA